MPGSASLSFTDPYQYQERIRPAEVQIIATARGEFRAILSQVELHRLTLQCGWQSLPAMARAALHWSRSSIMFHTGTAQPIRADGTDLDSDVLALGAPGEEHFFQTSSNCSWATLTLTPETYTAARTTLVADHFNPTMRNCIVRPPPVAMTRLRALHHRVMRLVPSAGSHGAHRQIVRAAEHALLAAVVDCLEGEGNRTVARLGSRNSTTIMRRLYELLDQSGSVPLYLMEVCARLGVSRRTLHAACAEHLGLGPHRFLWLRRMRLARQALIAADPRLATVTGIATDLGFWELGRFSVHYKWLFGESPSATLGRRRV
ncbi:MAG TPA: helix-turn-helix domain-containing protein [Acetobacteraceae bacterium]|jgi:AraC-like DNA-binding protein